MKSAPLTSALVASVIDTVFKLLLSLKKKKKSYERKNTVKEKRDTVNLLVKGQQESGSLTSFT